MYIYLYLKRHNITGLKYLGKTTKDPYSYNGSGKYWLRHLKKHGTDITTKILYQTQSNEDFRLVGEYFSKKWNIVKSKQFANLMTETGTGGAQTGQAALNISIGVKQSYINNPDLRRQRSESMKNYKRTPEHAKNLKLAIQKYQKNHSGVNSPFYNIPRSDEDKQSISTGTKKGMINSGANQKISESWLNRKIIECPHCDVKSKNVSNMNRWHFDNCKHK